MVGFLEDKDQNHQKYPSKAIQAEYAEDFTCCGPLIYRDANTDTINLVHQSAKDYLLSHDHLGLHSSLSQFYVVLDVTNFCIFQACRDYLNMKDFDFMAEDLCSTAEFAGWQFLERWKEAFGCFCFLQYAFEHWDKHVLAAETALHHYKWDTRPLSLRPTLHNSWLRRAARNGQSYVVQCLLDNGCMVDTECPMHYAALFYASAGGHETVVQLLLDRGAKVNAPSGYYGNALQAAASKGFETVVQLLLGRGAKINTPGGYYGNALQAAALKGHMTLVQLLLDRGADINAQGGYYGNALQAAAFEGLESIVQLLLDRGAKINAQGGAYGNALQAAALKGHMTLVQLLLDRGAEINTEDFHGRLGLYFAMRGNQEHVVGPMLAFGARIDPVQTDHQGCTSLHFAASGGSTEAIRLRLNSGANVNAVDTNGWTPLHWACRNGSESAVQFLVDSGAMLQSQDKQGFTPFDVAAICGNSFLFCVFPQSKNKRLDANGKQNNIARVVRHDADCDSCLHVSQAPAPLTNIHEQTEGLDDMWNSLQMR